MNSPRYSKDIQVVQLVYSSVEESNDRGAKKLANNHFFRETLTTYKKKKAVKKV